MAEEVETIKDHTVYFVDFGGYFGFSACVCAEGQHIRYANDYELHHKGKSRDELREIYRCFANCDGAEDYTNTNELFSACRFTDTQKAAYMAAQREYLKEQE